MEQEKRQGTIIEHFAELEDPRWYNVTHQLLDIVVIAICAAVCGADGWRDVELFGKTREKWLRELLELPNGIPSDDTFRRVFAALDAEHFQTCFMNWIEAVEGITEMAWYWANAKWMTSLMRSQPFPNCWKCWRYLAVS